MLVPSVFNRSFTDTLPTVDHDLGQMFRRVLDHTSTTYPVDIYEDADHLYVEAELPGFTREQIDITLDKNVLTIAANRQASERKEGWILSERRSTSFERSFQLAPTIDPSNVDAKLIDGVLTITLNRREESKPRKITVG